MISEKNETNLRELYDILLPYLLKALFDFYFKLCLLAGLFISTCYVLLIIHSLCLVICLNDSRGCVKLRRIPVISARSYDKRKRN